ncbi:predicted protein [Naegleria gruberi]|uniref:poly(ADP-ribose) glycohydrolase n=1 Tax=Naegleria gruberi TaxID=5762 RepID=D2VED1_NAEGR|nr:uncharacterized protein NAEGRDRAFT_67236 [Naegleria gruberi]EFC44858.1 predicted protein [Naegleria gruberi]|eukprot:XP_002677602.1 predicted protein [Naegleria gruberi strain NEG-M]
MSQQERYLILPTSPIDQVLNSGIVKLSEKDQELESVSFWTICQALCIDNDDSTSYSLTQIIDLLRSYRESSNSSSNFVISRKFDENELELTYMKTCVSTLDSLCESNGELLDCVKGLVLLLPELFPDGQVLLCSEANQKVELTRLQIATLVACMLIGAIQYPKKQLCGRKFVGFETSLREWTHKSTPSSETYLKILANYLRRMFRIVELSKRDESYSNFLNEKISVRRIRVDSNNVKQLVEENMEKLIEKQVMEILPSRMEQMSTRTSISTVFANKMIGPGSYSTQEELFFGIYPEMLPFSMICKEIEAEECLIVEGVYRQLENVTDFTFNRHVYLKESNALNESLNYLQPFGSPQTLLFIDAIPFDTEVELNERSNKCIMREITKAYSAFSQFNGQLINSGRWGCGAYGATLEIKVAIQKIVSTLTSNRLLICTGR